MYSHFLRRIALTVLLAVASVSCNSLELEQIRHQLREHEQEIQALKLSVEQINQDISSIRSVLSELRSGGYVSSVAEDVQEDVIVGYTMSFSDGRGVYLRTSANGGNPVPSISVRQDKDEIFYWTLNGVLLLDASERPIAVSDEGSAPLIKAEDGKW